MYMGKARVFHDNCMGQSISVYRPACTYTGSPNTYGLPVHVWVKYLYGTEHAYTKSLAELKFVVNIADQCRQTFSRKFILCKLIFYH